MMTCLRGSTSTARRLAVHKVVSHLPQVLLRQSGNLSLRPFPHSPIAILKGAACSRNLVFRGSAWNQPSERGSAEFNHKSEILLRNHAAEVIFHDCQDAMGNDKTLCSSIRGAFRMLFAKPLMQIQNHGKEWLPIGTDDSGCQRPSEAPQRDSGFGQCALLSIFHR